MRPTFFHLGIALAVLVLTAAAYGYWYAAVADESMAVASIEDEINAKTDTTQRIKSVRTALAGISGDEAAVQNYFVSQNNIVAFINDLEVRARAQGASITVLSVTSAAGAHPTLQMKLSIKGTFDSVMRTVGTIEYAPYAIRIETLSLGLNVKSGWSAELEVVVGSVTAPANPAAAPATAP